MSWPRNGEFIVSVTERMRTQQSALMRLRRNRSVYSLSQDRRILITLQSGVDGMVKIRCLNDTKGSDATKLNKVQRIPPANRQR